MKKMILIFSHQLNEKQIKSANNDFAVEQFVYLPKELQNIWSNIDPDLEKLDLESIKEFLKGEANSGDIVLIQGDFGACYSLVEFAKSLDLVPVYATTKRIAKEYLNEDGKIEKKSIFEFRRFRRYV